MEFTVQFVSEATDILGIMRTDEWCSESVENVHPTRIRAYMSHDGYKITCLHIKRKCI